MRDWQTLLETLLQWEQWLKADKLRTKDVQFAQDKHRHIMFLIKKIARCTKGMGLKISKFHGIVHIVDDILNFGVPMEVDTGSNESAHKSEKIATKLMEKTKNFLMHKHARDCKKSICWIWPTLNLVAKCHGIIMIPCLIPH